MGDHDEDDDKLTRLQGNAVDDDKTVDNDKKFMKVKNVSAIPSDNNASSLDCCLLIQLSSSLSIQKFCYSPSFTFQRTADGLFVASAAYVVMRCLSVCVSRCESCQNE